MQNEDLYFDSHETGHVCFARCQIVSTIGQSHDSECYVETNDVGRAGEEDASGGGPGESGGQPALKGWLLEFFS